MFSKLRSCLILSILIFLCSCSHYTHMRKNPNFSNMVTPGKRILVIPASAEINMVDAAGKKERMHNLEYSFCPKLDEAAKEKLVNMGYQATILHKADINDKNSYDAIMGIKSEFKENYAKLYSDHKLNEVKFAYNIDAKINRGVEYFQKKYDADLLMMMDYSGFQKTNGARTLDFAMAVLFNTRFAGNSEGSSLNVGLIDAKTGSIAWTTLSLAGADLFKGSSSDRNEQENRDRKVAKIVMDDALGGLKLES